MRGLALEEAPLDRRAACVGCDSESLGLLQLRARLPAAGQPRHHVNGIGEPLSVLRETSRFQELDNATRHTLLAMREEVELLRIRNSSRQGRPHSSAYHERLREVVKAFSAPRLSVGVAFWVFVMFCLVTTIVCFGTKKEQTVCCCCRSPCVTPVLTVLPLVMMVMLTIAVAGFATCYLSGALIKEVIEHFDLGFVGVNVDIDTVVFNPFNGHFEATNIFMHNPEGFTTDHLLTVADLKFDLDMIPLVFSLGKHVIVDNVVLSGVDVIYDMSWSGSNIYEVLDYLDSGSDGGYVVTVHKVTTSDISAKATSSLLNGVGIRLSVKDIGFTDLTQQVGEKSTAGVVEVVLSAILNSVLRAQSQASDG